MASPGATMSATAGTSKRPIFGSLRTRLIATHSFVLLLALALVLGISAGFLHRYEQTAAIDRLGELAIPVTVQAGVLTATTANHPMTPRQRTEFKTILHYEAKEWGVRLLVFDPKGRVLFDTATQGNQEGNTLTAYAGSIAAVDREARQGTGVHHLVAKIQGAAGGDPLGDVRLVVAAGSRSLPAATPRYVIGIAAPVQGVPLARRYLPPLLLAMAASLVVASLAGYVLSRRIAAPVHRLTAAADAMATGKLEQQVAGEGTDEIGRLVASFNAMSQRVAATARSQRDLLANIAHELRTPLTSVQGYTQALRDGVVDTPSDRAKALATISAEAERMGRLIGQLLDLARIESGQSRLVLRPVSTRVLLDGLARQFALEAARRNLNLELSAPPGLTVLGDEERLTQMLGNLVANALRFTPAGGTIAVSAARLAAPTGNTRPLVRLTVRDTGAGIPPGRLQRIFDRFERGNDPESGFGLGLAIVRELVQAHGGTITVESAVGVGTVFTLDLPAALATVEAERVRPVREVHGRFGT